MPTDSPSPKPLESCTFSNGLQVLVWLLLPIFVSGVVAASLIWEPDYRQRQTQQKLDELVRSLGPGAVDPDPDWTRAAEQINESQRSFHENEAKRK